MSTFIQILIKLKTWFSKNRGLLIVASVYLFTFLYMLPLRNQAFQDDFAYHLTAKTYYESGIMKLSDWGSASLISQIYWTTLFTKAFGYSMKIDHLSTIALFFIAIIAFYFLLKRLTDERRAIIFSITLFAFPWIFQFTYSYLSDIFSTSFMLISLFFYTKAIQDNNNTSYFFGSLFAGTAFLSRQTGIVIPLALFLILSYKSFVNRKIEYKGLLLSLVPFIIIFFCYQSWLKIPGNLTNAQFQVIDAFKKQTLPYLVLSVLGNTGATFGYYATYLQRILLYFHHSIGFLLPLFLMFNLKLKVVTNILKKYKKGIIITALIYLFIYSINYYYHFGLVSYTIEVPKLITRYGSLFPINWDLSWKYFVYLSVPLWLIIIGVSTQQALSSIFKKKNIIDKRLFVYIGIIVILLALLLQSVIFKISFQHFIPSHYAIEGFIKFRMYLDIIFSSQGIATFKYTWLIIFILLFLALVPLYIFTHYKLKRIKINYELAFLSLVFIFQSLIIVIYMYFHWAQYIIPFISFFLILLAIFSKKYLPINPLRAALVLIALLMFSLNLTNNRYHEYGIRWEMTDKLIAGGIEPIDIDFPEESWLPFWYFEETFKKKADQLGSKYLIKPGIWATWRTIKSKSNYVYSFYNVPISFKYDDRPDWEIVADSGVQRTGFFIKKRVVAIS